MLANHVENVDFTNQLICLQTRKYSTKEQWAAYLDSEAHPKDVITECIHTLKLLVFGSDMAGKKSYLTLKRQIRQFRVDVNHGIKKWPARIDNLQSYLPLMLWEAGALKGQSPTKFNEQDLCKNLEGSLNKYHISKLTHLDWDVSMKPYRESISKLESVESDIIQTKNQEERLAKLEGTGKNKRKRAEDSKETKTGDHKGKGKGKGNKWRNNNKNGSPFEKSYQ